MREIDGILLFDYLDEKKITITNKYHEGKVDNFQDEVKTLIEFQKRMLGYTNNIFPRLEGNIGKFRERNKIVIRDLKLNLIGLRYRKLLNSMDKYILSNGEEILMRANKALYSITEDEYIYLIKRSMSRYEICIGKSDSSNLILSKNGFIFLGTIKYMSYNLLEHDLYNLIRSRKKLGIKIDYKEAIEKYVNELKLTAYSYKYLNMLCEFPSEEIRIWNKYRKDKAPSDIAKYVGSIKKAKKNDTNNNEEEQ